MFPVSKPLIDQGHVPSTDWFNRLEPLRIMAVALVLAIVCSGHGATAASRVMVEPVQEPELASILAERSTLPLLLDLAEEVDIAAEITAEIRRMTNIMVSLGYLEARIYTDGDATEESPLRLKPVPGRLYRVGWIRVDGLPSEMPENLTLGLNLFSSETVGKNATKEVMRDITRGVLFQLRESAYGMASVADPIISVDPQTRTAGVVVSVQPGTQLLFGEVTFRDSTQVANAQVQALVPFESGSPYSITAIDALQTALERSNLFRRVRIELADEPNATGHIDVIVQLRDRAPDPVALAQSSGVGPTRLIVTMLMIVLLECVRVTSYWSHTAVRRALSTAVMLMIGVSGLMILERLYGFLL